MSDKRVHVVVKGKVQGVFFRSSASDKASSLGLNGWIRNRPEGDVEAVFEGDAEAVDEMLSWCRKGSGPADVNDVRVSEEEYKGDLEGFQVR
ncbi:MAG: acylphosphatase [Candidatus Omnitrophica bacterium]|nr:acylphosphatase [Candidatus Omnitrophota bacterium]